MTNDTPTGPWRPGHSGVPLLTAVLVAVALLATIAASVVLSLHWASAADQANLDASERTAVVRVAEQFTVRVNNYDSTTVDGYQQSITPMLSTKFKAQFSKAMTEIIGQVKQAKMVSKGEVLASGVSEIDADSAQVLVVADASVKTVYDQRKRHFRWQVSLVKVDGHWLVDDFTPVA